MDGFVDGVAPTTWRTVPRFARSGWDKTAQDGSFTGDFEDIDKGKVLAEGFIDQGADVILPVAGQVGERCRGCGDRARRRLGSIWVDSNGIRNAAVRDIAPCLLTSVLKNTQHAMVQIVARRGRRLGSRTSRTIGTLANGGVRDRAVP